MAASKPRAVANRQGWPKGPTLAICRDFAYPLTNLLFRSKYLLSDHTLYSQQADKSFASTARLFRAKVETHLRCTLKTKLAEFTAVFVTHLPY